MGTNTYPKPVHLRRLIPKRSQLSILVLLETLFTWIRSPILQALAQSLRESSNGCDRMSFYIGYLPKAPSELTRFVKGIVIALLVLSALVAASLVIAQRPFKAANFEFARVRTFEGVVEARPYPTLLVRRPGASGAPRQFSRYLLVGTGKHGASDLAPFDGASVRLEGKLIYNGEQTLIELKPGTVRIVNTERTGQSLENRGEPVTVSGEIVDSKCNAGVMNPGSGKVHRDCAVRCLSGGIPPVLVEIASPYRQFLLTDLNGNALPPADFLDVVAEPVKVTGLFIKHGDQDELRVQTIGRNNGK